MARIDDYKQAMALSKEELSEKNIDIIAERSGSIIHTDSEGAGALSLTFLNRELALSWPELDFSYSNSDEEVPIQQQVLTLHYLNGCCSLKETKITGEWISFQDVPDGRFYISSFIKRAKDPMLKAFGENPGLMVDLAEKAYETSPLHYGDSSVIVKALPLITVALVLWEGDEEFPPEGNILFDKSIPEILSAEDIAWLAGMVVYPLIGMAAKAVND